MRTKLKRTNLKHRRQLILQKVIGKVEPPLIKKEKMYLPKISLRKDELILNDTYIDEILKTLKSFLFFV